MENLQVGTLGWRHDAWLGSFYPEDLPEDWQLDYFSNAFRVVLVPQAEWMGWDKAMLETLEDSVEGEFYFYLALESSEQITEHANPISRQLNRALSALSVLSTSSNRVGGLVVLPSFKGTEADLLSVIQFSDSANLPLTLVSETAQLEGWSWQHNGLWMSGNPLAFLTDLTADGKAQSLLLTSFYQSLPLALGATEPKGAPVIIGFGGDDSGLDKVDVKRAANLKVVCEFLGY